MSVGFKNILGCYKDSASLEIDMCIYGNEMIDEYQNLKAYTYFHCMWLFAHDYRLLIVSQEPHTFLCIYYAGCKPTTIRYHWRSTITYLLEINSSSISPFRVTVGTISGDCRTFHFQHLHENEDVPSSNGYFEKSFFFFEVSVEVEGK